MIHWKNRSKITLIGTLVVGITFLHYSTQLDRNLQHAFYRELYFLPIVLAGFWFGLRGALLTSFSITMLYLPLTLMHWNNSSSYDFSNLLELFLFNAIAAILGRLIDRKQAEQSRLREAESLAAMGRAVSSAAHDMKTPLIAIGGFSRLVQKRLKEDDPNRQKLDLVVSETQRLENMVIKMLDFSRPLELDKSRECVEQVIGECLSILTDLAQERKVRIETRLAKDLPMVEFDIMRMKQVFINLGTNAIQASPEGEVVTVRASQKNESVIIDVVDCGCGIPLNRKKEIFHPFFTTKKEGTGLGLPIVEKIVEAHEGRLEVLDNHKNGVTFRVVLPVEGNRRRTG
jgi:signal transduction histidine kinase